ncbi:unnamed protein product [Spodoptera exigua]|nr:unnamed protein product [Spodoptera exigua]
MECTPAITVSCLQAARGLLQPLLFEENQDLLNMFEKFRQCRTKEEQINSMELAEHANNVMNTLDEGIKGLDDLDNFFGYIHQVGASHRRIPGFKVEYFWGQQNIHVTKPDRGYISRTAAHRWQLSSKSKAIRKKRKKWKRRKVSEIVKCSQLSELSQRERQSCVSRPDSAGEERR